MVPSANLALKLSEKPRMGLRNGILVSVYHPNAPSERRSHPFSESFLTEFSAPLCQAALLEGVLESAMRLLKTASEMRLLRHRSASLRDLPSAIFLR